MSHSNGNGIATHPLSTPGAAPAESQSALPQQQNNAISYLLFESRGSLCGVAAIAVSEVLLLPEIALLDGAPHWVGVLDVRGRIVPIVDMGELAGAPHRRFQTTDSIVLIESDSGGIGIIVERVRDVRPLFPTDIEIAPSGVGAGLARVDGELVRLFDLAFFSRFTERPNPQGQQAPARPFCPEASPSERTLFVERARSLRGDDTAEGDAVHAPSLVAVRLGGELFGFDLKWVREFAVRPPVTPVPGAPHDLLGLVNLRGEVVPLLDLRAALGLPTEGDPGEQITFVECDGLHVGVAVEAVLDVFAPREGDLLPPPVASGVKGDSVSAAVFHGETTLAVLDLCHLLQQGGWTAREAARTM